MQTKQQTHEPKRLMRHVEKTVARYIWKHPALWGQSKDDVFAKALEAVWESGARTPGQATKAIYSALAKSRDDSKHNRSCLEPFLVRKAEKSALEKGVHADPDAARQTAYREFLEDYTLYSQRTAFREFDRLRVRQAVASLRPADREIARRYMKLGSVKSVAMSYGVAPRTYLSREWADFKERFISAWNLVDEESLARIASSNPDAFAGRCVGACHGE